jgi:polyisoprenoid-binding protein YceI
MKSIRIAGVAASVLLAMGAGMAGAQVKDYKIDSNHSEANFSIKHLAISTVHGSFHAVTGVVHFDPADVTKMSVDAAIDVSTVSTGITARDTHLKSADFF